MGLRGKILSKPNHDDGDLPEKDGDCQGSVYTVQSIALDFCQRGDITEIKA
jgi:hypothetical protein